MTRELEVKILNVDFKEIEARIIKLDGKLIADEEQMNIVIDSSKDPIASRLNGYMRIRITRDLLLGRTSNTLTLKEKMARENIRENIEYNVEIDDVKTTLEILDKLGYDKMEVGYKDRKSYSLADSRIDFDIWDEKTYPYPYIEIEVKDEDHLREILDLLDIEEENVSLKSIGELKEELTRKE